MKYPNSKFFGATREEIDAIYQTSPQLRSDMLNRIKSVVAQKGGKARRQKASNKPT